MPKRRPPWWVALALVCCTSYVLSFWWVSLAGPEPSGLAARPDEQGLIVRSVEPGSPADRAGLRAGDAILSVNGRTEDPDAGLLLVRAGGTYDVLVQRGAERSTLTLTFGRRRLFSRVVSEDLIQLVYAIVAALSLALAWLVVSRRRDDAVALLGALLLGSWPVGLIQFEHGAPPGLMGLFASLPGRLGMAPVLAAVGTAALSPSIALMFFASFPGQTLRRRWIWTLVWIPAAIGFLVGAVVSLDLLYGDALSRPVSPVVTRLLLVVFPALCFVAMPPLVVWRYRGATDINARRRMRVLVVGILVTTSVRLFHIALRRMAPESAAAYEQTPWFLAASLLAAAFPCAMAYAILRHRLFDLGVMVRQGLQYAAARGLLLGLAPLCGLLLVADLGLHANQTLAEAFVQRGWLYAALGTAALVAHAKRLTWLEAVDRRFFRERYDARQVLGSLLTDLRQAVTLNDAAPPAVAKITEALHPTGAAILLRRPEAAAFRVIAASGAPPPEVPADSKLMALLRLLGKPLENPRSDTGWLRQQLPPGESRWLQAAHVEWIFPISIGEGRTEALLVLGPKRSEEPYSREDHELLEGITSGLALLHERLTSPPAAPGPAGLAEPSAAPSIAARYVIRRELGRGGMGTVYEARDTELARAVAVKVMRPELVSSAEALARFKREARAAASFSHPNVVTVYDVGVAGDGRAYLVMELLSGSTLRASLREHHHFPPTRAAAILRGVGAAVEAAHQQSLLHRDLKPENVFLVRTDTGEVPKILDFGVARLMASGDETMATADTAPGQLLGTLAYMSPEQLRGLPPTAAWDLWALAVIAYEMLTGVHPFAGPGAGASVDLASRRVAPVATDLGIDGDAWNAFFARALAPDARERPASARALVAVFEAAL